jgi:hypothetical protein
MKRTIIAVLLFASLVCVAQVKRHFHIHQLDYTSFQVSCDNGGDPTVIGKGKDIVVSCGK